METVVRRLRGDAAGFLPQGLESSPVAQLPKTSRKGKGGPKPAKQRRERRSVVAEMLADGYSAREIWHRIGARYSVDTKTINADCQAIYEEWAGEDADVRERQLAILIRNINTGWREARKARNFGAMTAFAAMRMRFVEQTSPDGDAAPALSWARLMKEIQREEEAEEVKPANITLLQAPKTEAT